MGTFGKRISKPKPAQTKGEQIVEEARKAREKDQQGLDDQISRNQVGVERKRRRVKVLFG